MSLPPQQQGRKSEAAAAKRFGAKLQPGSGNGPDKNDFLTPDPSRTAVDPLSIEWKYTGSIQYPLRRREIEAAATQALIDGRSSLFGVEFTSPRPGVKPLRVVVQIEDDFVALHNRVEELEIRIRDIKYPDAD